MGCISKLVHANTLTHAMSRFTQRLTANDDRERLIVRYDMSLDMITAAEFNETYADALAFYLRAQSMRVTNAIILGIVQTIRQAGTCRLTVGAPHLYKMISMLRKHVRGVVDDACAEAILRSLVGEDITAHLSLRADLFISQVIDRGMASLLLALQHMCREPLCYDMLADSISTRKRYDEMMAEMSSDDSL